MRKELDHSLIKQAETIYNFVQKSDINLADFEADSIYASPDELVYDLIFEALAYNPKNTFVQIKVKDKIVFKTANLVSTTFNFKDQKEGLELFDYNDPNLSDYLIRVVNFKKKEYNITVAYPLDLIYSTLNNLLQLYILIFPFSLIISFVVGAFLSFRALARIDKIINRTEEIDAYNLNAYLEGEDASDEYGRLVRTLNNMLKRIKSSIEYMNYFTVSASHELKTPLTILRGELELALKSTKSNEEYLEIIKSSYEETMRLINIIDRLFLITKLDNSIINLNISPIDLTNLLNRVVNDFSFLLREKKIKVKYNLDTNDDLFINADGELLKQLFINLLDNAIKYSYPETEIVINCKKTPENKVRFEIINQSEHIPEDVLPHLFERFYRVESSRNRGLGGIGLGLSIVKQIVDLHKFSINLKSEKEGYFIVSIIM
ncbi:MAG: ATP-binding protein [Ignavibacteria bacterium]|jgi:signal transduction histidine kinase|nr:ATP-binding protein [Ignavibacteria bacterium]MDH7527936.1 ATP-binding protein [Ignavibacteria bacterium]NPV11810.1 GHKL domain-containing protein [Ignavibacteria bacterium]